MKNYKIQIKLKNEIEDIDFKIHKNNKWNLQFHYKI